VTPNGPTRLADRVTPEITVGIGLLAVPRPRRPRRWWRRTRAGSLAIARSDEPPSPSFSEIEPYDIAPVEKPVTISLTGSDLVDRHGGRAQSRSSKEAAQRSQPLRLVVEEPVLLEHVVEAVPPSSLELDTRSRGEQWLAPLAAPLDTTPR